MVLIGARVIVLCHTQGHSPEWKCGFIRASTEPLERLTDLLRSDIQVCIEYDGSDSQQFISLLDSTLIQAVYIEDCLIWAKRLLPQRPSGVAWPARAFKLLIGQAAHAAGMIVIEYLLDIERTIIPLSQIKEFTMSTAKETLTGHSQLLRCLEKVDEERRFQNLLMTGGVWLVGQEVEVFRCFTRPWFSALVRDQNTATGELTILDSNVLMPYRVEYSKVQVRLPEGIKLDDLLATQNASRRTSSRRLSISAPPPPPPVPSDNVISGLGAWSMTDIADTSSSPSSSHQPTVTTFGTNGIGGPMVPPTTLPNTQKQLQPKFRAPGPLDPMGPLGAPGPLTADKRTMSMCNIQTIDRMAEPSFQSSTLAQTKPPVFHPPRFTEMGVSSTSLIRSASQPVLAGQKPDLDHILSVISRDPSVQNLTSLPEDSTTPVEVANKRVGSTMMEEDLHTMTSNFINEEESFARSNLTKSMPMLHKMATSYSQPVDFQPDMTTTSLPDQTFGNASLFYPTDTHPLTMYRGFQSEINLAKPSVHDRDFINFYRESMFPNSQSMTSLISSDFDSEDSHDDRLLNGEFPGKRRLSGREGNPQAKRRGRGRPRLTEEEKLRRKELRDRGLMRKNKKRRTRDEMIRDKIERQQNPKQRGRKKGCKRGTVKDINGVLISLGDLQEEDEMLQVAPCCSFVGVGPCQECWPNKMSTHQNCRFVEFRRLRVSEVQEESVRWETAGFAGKEDVKPEHLAHWIPLKTGYSGMDESAAYMMLSKVAQLYINIVEKERAMFITAGGDQANWNWKRAVGGVRELCDVCYTTLFNIHFVCPNCGFAACLDCYNECTTNNDQQQPDWPKCVTCGAQPHLPAQLIPTYIIPNMILWELTESVIQSCQVNRIPLQVSPQLSEIEMRTVDNGNREADMLTKSFVDFEPFVLDPGGQPQEVHLAPYTLLCGGRLLQLLNPTHHDNMKAFELRWTLGEPVLISNVQDCLAQHLWSPLSFNRDFGSERVDLVDCRSGLILPDVPAQQFWIGFENVRSRLRDQATDEPMLLKLKDWPPTEDFSEKLPRRFEDIMQALPMGDYTRRDGKLNMVSSLPSHFVKPDMGPKMYIAYGSPYYPTLGTTNLHLDMSDAVNVLVYANCAEPILFESEEEQILEVVKQECCPTTVERIQHSALRVGAIWHIFHSSDAGKIRQFIKKVQVEQGVHSFPGSDPIHDQRMYLNAELRQRLELEYGVRGWAIAQCVGDAVFIPAGAPHQVRNICSCIKIAEDFVSPQHVPECLKLTDEFRHLSDLHNNHEDKLQIKNIIYHAMKDAVGAQQNTKTSSH